MQKRLVRKQRKGNRQQPEGFQHKQTMRFQHEPDYQPIGFPHEPAYKKRLEQAIACTLMDSKLKGNSEGHMQTKEKHLRALAERVNLFRPKQVTLTVLNAKNRFHPDKPLSNGYKKKLFEYYNDFCKSNQIPFDKPKLKYQPPIPLIPTKQQVQEIINASTKDFACIFTILAEIGCSQMELHKTPRSQINVENNTISINGTKQHNNGVYKLKQQTADMLKKYLSRHTQEYPFPKSNYMCDAWVRARNRTVEKLCKPELNNIPLKNLRNYAGAQFYLGKGNHDPIATMRFMRHKRLEQTLHYIQNIDLEEEEEYTTKTIQLGQPDTIKRIEELSNAGFQFFCEADGHQAFRKRK
jgi:integrase